MCSILWVTFTFYGVMKIKRLNDGCTLVNSCANIAEADIPRCRHGHSYRRWRNDRCEDVTACPATSLLSLSQEWLRSPWAGHASGFHRIVRHAQFSSQGSSQECPLGMHACAVDDELSCTRLQNYTMGASLMSVSNGLSLWLQTRLL